MTGLIVKHARCPLEEATTAAVVSGNWPEGLTAHVEECAVCREIAETGSLMQHLAKSVNERDAITLQQENLALPDPEFIWRRAQADRHNADKTLAALEWLQTASAAAVPIGLAGWVAWNWYSIEALTDQFLLMSWPELSFAIFALGSLAPAALMVAALALGYPLLAGE